MAPVQLAGKSAPRLVQDIQLYDPAHEPETGRNLLSETPPIYAHNYAGHQACISPEACKHQYVLKPDQTFVAQPEQRRTAGTLSKISAMCSKCRCHLQVVVNYTTNMNMFNRILKGEHIHHLVYKSGRQKNRSSMPEETSRGQIAETFHYQCLDASCAAMVSLRILSPVLSADFVHLMTDKELLRQRAEVALTTYSETMEGMGVPEPMNVLDNLRLYITNSLRNPNRSKPIASGNKRFMHVFGVEGAACKELLEFLGFAYVQDTGVWHPPKPQPDAEKPYQDPLCGFLDDVVCELLALIYQRPASERRGSQLPDLSPSAIPDILYALEAHDYPKDMRAKEFQMASTPCYEDLGAVEDMSATAIVEAYKHQTNMDSAWMGPHYLSCLKQIAILRKGFDVYIIDKAIQEAYADGKYATEDIEFAYQKFGLDPQDHSVTDDKILKHFFDYISLNWQEAEARRDLWRIGDSRQSERIMSAADDRLTTVEEANVYLGVENETPDDFVLTMYTAKINDNPAAKSMAHRAVELIAKSRNSVALNHFLHTGETPASEMDIGDAYRLLQIPDRTADDGAIMAAYTICVDENPGDAEKYNQALVIIAKNMDSSLLNTMAGINTEPERNMQDWPVGLQNIGNTCYLNSLLQFYFSVRPFREMVLDFEMFQMDLNDMESLSKKKVGSLKVTKKEVERSIKFLKELRTLYIDMITSSQASVTPAQELARLTLISPSNEAAIRRRSTITATRSQILDDIKGGPVLGPLGPPPPVADMDQSSGSDVATVEHVEASSASASDSEATLVSDNTMNDAPGPYVEENDSSQANDAKSDQAETGSDVEMTIDTGDNDPVKSETLEGPPPIPPRPVAEIDREKQLRDELEFGAQQDVTEVINNLLFQSEYAIKARSIGEDGEQIDQIKDLFFGQTRSYISTEKGKRFKEERWCDIKVDVAHGPRDIYGAIDGAFDVQKIMVDNSVAEQFASISRIPPILQVHVRRTQFDPVKKATFKSTNHLGLLETIYMDRYMDTKNPDILNRRIQCWEWKASLETLEARREELLRTKESDGMDKAALLEEAKRALLDLTSFEKEAGFESASEGLGIDPNLVNDLERSAEQARSELKAVDQEIKDTQTMLASQFADSRKLPYQLYAAFMHRGSVSFGHYYIYIFDFEKNIWRKYNDEYVTEVENPDEIFKSDDTSNPPTPYFLVYVNSEMKERLVNPVCRELNQAMPDLSETGTSNTEDTKVASPTGDVNMDPPSYEEASASKGTPDHSISSTDRPVNPLKRKSVDAEGNPTGLN